MASANDVNVPTGRRLVGLDLLRFVALALVLGRHLEGCPADWPAAPRWVMATWLRGGWVGVDLFFVLSGFLVSGLLFAEYRGRGRLSLGRFYTRRGWKIYPAFFTMLGFTLLMNFAVFHRPL